MTQDYEQLKHNKQYADNLNSIKGFLLNVDRAYRERVITFEQKEDLIKGIFSKIIDSPLHEKYYNQEKYNITDRFTLFEVMSIPIIIIIVIFVIKYIVFGV